MLRSGLTEWHEPALKLPRSTSAPGAGAENVEPMSFGSEACAARELADGAGESLLKLARCLKILHTATAHADEVVVVTARDPFGKLEPSVFIATHHSVHDPGLFEKGEVLVRRTLRQAWFGLHQLGRRDRPIGLGQGVDQDLAPGRQSLPCSSKASGHDGVQVIIHASSLEAVLPTCIGNHSRYRFGG